MERDRTLRVLGFGGLAVGLVILLFGLRGLATLPPGKPMPNNGDEFMSGGITIGEVGRRNDEWFEASARRSEATFTAGATTMLGVFLSVVGASILFMSSRRLRRVAYAEQEFAAEAIARGLQHGFANTERTGTEEPESRLTKLESLHARGLVTDSEYRTKREAILADI